MAAILWIAAGVAAGGLVVALAVALWPEERGPSVEEIRRRLDTEDPEP